MILKWVFLYKLFYLIIFNFFLVFFSLNKFYLLANTPKPQSILLRLTILLYSPHIFPNLGREILGSLPWILPMLDEAFNREQLLNFIDVGYLEKLLKSNEELPLIFYEKIDKFWLNLVSIKAIDKDWMSDLNEILLNSYKLYCNNPEFIGWLCKMNGILLSRSDRIEQIKYGLEKMFTLAHLEYSNNMLNISNSIIEPSQSLRYSVAEAFGYISINHFDVVLEKIRQILNSEIIGKKQNTGIVSFFMKGASQDESTVSVKITVVLALGFIAKHANPSTLYNKIEGAIINNILPFMEKHTNYQLKTACQKAILMVSNALERIFLNPELKIDDQFRIFISKHREKLLEKSSMNYLSEKPNDLKLFSINTISSLLRLEPAYECERYHWLFNEAIELLWENGEKPSIKDAFCEVLDAILYHEILHFAPKEGLELGLMNYWELLVWVLLRVEKKNEGANEKKTLGFLMSFFEQLAKNLEGKTKKLKFNNKFDRKNGLKVLLNVIIYVYYEISEFRNIILVCVNCIVKSFDCEGNEILGFENPGSFNQMLVKNLGEKLSMEEIYFIIEEIIEILKNSKFFLYFFLNKTV